MNLYLPTLALLLLSPCAQKAAAHDSLATYPRHQVKASPLKLVGLVYPGIDLAYEHSYNKHLSTQLSAGLATDLFGTTPYVAYSGYRVGVEQKYLPPQTSKLLWFYPSLSAAYSNTSLKDVARFHNVADTPFAYSNGYTDTFSMRRQSLAINANIGILMTSGHFVCEVAWGLGVKFRKSIHHDRINPADNLAHPRHPSVYYAATKETNEPTISAPLFVIRMGYCF